MLIRRKKPDVDIGRLDIHTVSFRRIKALESLLNVLCLVRILQTVPQDNHFMRQLPAV